MAMHRNYHHAKSAARQQANRLGTSTTVIQHSEGLFESMTIRRAELLGISDHALLVLIHPEQQEQAA